MGQNRIIHSRRCWTEGQFRDASLIIENGIISSIHPGPYHPESDKYIDVGSDVLMPGVIDAHVHINEPGRTDWEGFDTATRAAAFGGTTTMVDMPLNSSPVTTSVPALEAKLEAATKNLHVNCGFWAGVIGQDMNTLVPLLESGCLGAKAFLIESGIDEFPAVDLETLEKTMPALAKIGVPLLVHCELEQTDVDQSLLRRNPSSYLAFLASRPKSWENAAIRMMIELCEKHQCRTHIVHLSSADVLPDIKRAKEAGLPLTVETCTHYIFFNAEDIPDAHPLYKCTPPIREHSNNAKLRAAVKAGLIDFITTDHSPAPPEIKALKTGDFSQAWGGISAIQFLLPAAWTALKDCMSLQEFVPLLTRNPAEFIGVDRHKGSIATGYDADLVVWSPEEQFVVHSDQIQFRHKISPFTGHSLYGKVQMTIVAGNLVYNGRFAKSHCGSTILRQG